MKWLIFAIGMAGVLPLTVWLRQNRSARHYAIAVLVALPFLRGLMHRLRFMRPVVAGYAEFDVSIMDLLRCDFF